MSVAAAVACVVADTALDVGRTFYGDDRPADRCIVLLKGRQGLIPVGEPGIAEPLLSGLPVAAMPF